MRQLRSSLVSDTMSSSTGMLDHSRGVSSRATRYSEPVTAYNVAPKQRLNLVDVKVGLGCLTLSFDLIMLSVRIKEGYSIKTAYIWVQGIKQR